jgi:hypothetical protein
MQNYLILVLRKMVRVVIKVMYLPGSWERRDMLPQNILQQVTFVRCILVFILSTSIRIKGQGQRE